MNRRILLALGAAVVAVVLFVVLRPEDEDETVAPTTTASSPTTTPTTTESSPDTTTTEPPPPEEEGVQIEIDFRDGRLVGGVRRMEIERGERVAVVVRSDVADHVHVHGLDILRDVAPGAPARLRFRPRDPGVVEIELEDRHLLLAELEVTP